MAFPHATETVRTMARAVPWTLGTVACSATLTVSGCEAGPVLDTFEIMA